MVGHSRWLVFLCFGLCRAWMDERPVLESRDGNLYISSARDRNITLKILGSGYVNVNDINLLHVTTAARDASRVVERWKTGILLEMELNLQRLTDVIEGPHGLQRRMNMLDWGGSGNTTNDKTTRLPFSGDRSYIVDKVARNRIRQVSTELRDLGRIVKTLLSELAADHCQGDPCKNGGTCKEHYQGYKCVCPPSWEGPNCATDVNECARFEGTDLGCQNGATCVNLPGTYQCSCTSGWYGIHCTKKSLVCNTQNSDELCGHGVCVNKLGSPLGYTCICDQGWEAEGTNPACIKDVDECAGRHPSCSVNPPVQCINVPGTFYCGTCPQGYSGNGYYCTDIDECATNNGGCSTSPMAQCINTLGSRICGPCPPGYRGDGVSCFLVGACTINNGGCHPLATCTDNPAISDWYVSCRCPYGYVGDGMGPRGCQPAAGGGTSVVTTNACSSNPCIHGQCLSEDAHVFTCVCSPGFTGPTCRTTINPCSLNPCKNNGQCTVAPSGAVLCLCTGSYSGPRCETPRDTCGGVIRDPIGVLQFPLRGTNYQHGLSCAWVLTTNHSMVLNITFTDFHLETSRDCRFDFLQVHDGRSAGDHLIGRYCGHNLPQNGTIISSHNNLYLWFHSDSSISHSGFYLTWKTIPPVCGGEINAEHGTISSPGSPGKYPPNRDCFWQISVSHGKRIQFHFFTMMLEEHPTCAKDFLKIAESSDREDSILGVYCNHTHPPPLTTTSNEAFLHFHSDGVGRDAGFQITFSSVPGLPGCGGIYTDLSGEITNPTRSSTYLPNMRCEWLIQVPPGEKIKLDWITFNLEESRSCHFDFVEVYSGSTTDSPLVGRYCGSDLPPSVKLESNVVLLVFRSDWSYNAEGFRVRYETICGGLFTDLTGIITSPSYPKNYPPDKICIYKIAVPSDRSIVLTLTDMDIEESTGCYFDNLEVRDGDNENSTLIGTYCGPDDFLPEPMYSTFNYMYLKFTTEHNIEGRGFQANYTTIVQRCGGMYKAEAGVIQSPGDGRYDNGETCTWLIQAPVGHIIQLTWVLFQLEYHTKCAHDYVKVYDNYTSDESPPIGSYCGAKIPPVLMSQGNMMTIVFHSDSSITREGFVATYVFLDANKFCGGRFYAITGVIRTPNYPANYPIGRECIWVIEAPSRQQVKLTVETFRLENHTSCNFDYLEIRNGGYDSSPLIGKYCGTNMPQKITSMSNQIYLKFVSDSSRSEKGFSLLWDSTTIGCGGTLTSTNGAITSPNYPQPYTRSAECTWKIVVSAGSVVQIIIVDLELEEHATCRFDYVEIFDGPDKRGKSLGRFCGSSYPPYIKSTSNVVTVIFRSDFTTAGRGFHIKYNTLCHNSVRGFRGVIESPNFPNNYMHSTNCSWVINAPLGNKVNVTFSHFELEGPVSDSCVYDYVEIKEGENDLPNQELGKFCDSLELPPPLSSTQSQVFINFMTDSFVTYSGFRLEWVIHGCGGHFKRPFGSFSSPGYPKPYPEDIECEWLIEVDFWQSIEITLQEVHTEKSAECYHDKMTIYGGENEHAPMLVQTCHSDHPITYTTPGNKAFIKFESDFSFSGKGFTATYKSVRLQCGGLFTTPSGYIHSANYPKNYPHNQNCEWLLRVDVNHVVNLTFIDFDLEDTANCTDDYVKIFDGSTKEDPLLGTHCRSSLPPSYISTSNELLIVMRSDSIVTSKGFRASYSIACGARIVTNENGVLIPSSDALFGFNSENCTWIIVAENPADHVTLTFTYMNLASTDHYDVDQQRSYQTVDVFEGEGSDGPLRGSWSGYKAPPPVVSEGNALTVVLSPLDSVSANHFRAIYSVLNTACGGVYESKNGTIVSPGYPNSGPSQAECVWILQTAPGSRISLNFVEFNLGCDECTTCDINYLEVREVDGAGKVLGLWCGSQAGEITSMKTLWVKFRKDQQFTSGNGFMAEYSLVHSNELEGPSGEIASPLYPNFYTMEGDYSWRITVASGWSIRITFTEFHTDATSYGCYGYVAVYDGYNNEAPTLLSHCGISIPDEIISTGNVVYIELNTATYQEGSKFFMKWLQVPRDVRGTSITEISECEEIVSLSDPTSLEYRFSSPGWPNGYKNDLNCSWIFESLPGTSLSLNFKSISLNSNSYCLNDYVAVYSGIAESTHEEWTLVTKVCNSESKGKIISASNLMRVEFITDAYSNGTGFEASVLRECGGRLGGPNGEIEITNSSLITWRKSWTISCNWTISVRPGRTIQVDVTELKTGTTEGGVCGNSYLMLKNGGSSSSPILGAGKYCGSELPPTLKTTGNELFVKIQGVKNALGLILRYREVGINCGGNYYLTKETREWEMKSPNYPNIPSPHTECTWTLMTSPGDRLSIHFVERFDLAYTRNCEREYLEIRDGGTEASEVLGKFCGDTAPSTMSSTGNVMYIHYYTDIPDPKNGFKAVITTGLCGGILRGSTGVITSPNYPAMYPKNVTCVWVIVGPRQHMLKLQFLDLHLPSFRSCQNTDHVSIGERFNFNTTHTEERRFCGSTNPGIIETTSDKLVVTFDSDDREYTNYRGFSLNYSASQEACGGSLKGLSGTFQSPGYPSGNPLRRYCEWQITVPPGFQVVVDILDMALGNEFNWARMGNRLSFYNDFNYKSRIAYVPPTDTRRQFRSSGNTMMVWFWSTGSGHRGFKARFTAVAPAPCGGEVTGYHGFLYSPRPPLFNQTNFFCKWLIKSPVSIVDSNNATKQTLTLTLTGLIGYNVSASRSCKYFMSNIKISSNTETLATICGNLTEPQIVRSPYNYNVLSALKGFHANITNFTVEYQWQSCGGILSGPEETVEAPKGLSYPLSCVWFARFPDEGEAIRLTFENLNLGSCENGYISIRNGGPMSPEMGKYCGSLKPDPLTSQSNEMWIEYHVKQDPSNFRFRLETVSGGCGGALWGSRKIIGTPGFPKPYPNNAECTWEIMAEPGYSVALVFVDRFQMETSNNCEKDFVQVFGWKSKNSTWEDLGKFCGRNAPAPVKSTTNRMKVLFRSNEAIQGDGFTARWEENCGGIFDVTSHDQKYIQSPGYPHAYTGNLFCNYTLLAPGKNIRVDFTDFFLEDDQPDCSYDNVTITTKIYAKNLAVKCGHSVPTPYRSKDMVEIIFRTDKYVHKRGFELKYYLDECGGTITQPSEIVSPVFIPPGSHFPFNCTWIITAPAKKSVVVRFQKFQIIADSRCSIDSLSAFEGHFINETNKLGEVCGNLTLNLPVFKSESNKLTINYQTSLLRKYTTFKAEVLFANTPAEGCGGHINLTSNQKVMYFNTQIGNTYDPDQDCHWTVEAGRNMIIRMTIISMDLKNSTDGPCSEDYIEIFDGRSPFSESIGRYCGSTWIPPPIFSMSNVLWIRFVTNSNKQGSGVVGSLESIPSICGEQILRIGNKNSIITSPGYPQPYPSGISCRWTLESSFVSAYGSSQMNIHFIDLDLEDTQKCTGDRLQISEHGDSRSVVEGFGQNLTFSGQINQGDRYMSLFSDSIRTYSFCGNVIPQNYYSASKFVDVTFRSTASEKMHKGFKLEVSSLSCSRNYTSLQGRIVYNGQQDCWITITVPENYTISLYFTQFNIYDNEQCTHSAFQVREGSFSGNVLATLCGATTPSPIFSTGNKLSLHTWSKQDYESYDITYTSTNKGRGCGGEIYNYAGSLASPLYPNSYRNDSTCTWLIVVPVGRVVYLQFYVFDLGNGDLCDTNNVQLYDVLENGEQSWRNTYCGGDRPASFKSTTSKMILKYNTSVNNGGTGWTAYFIAREDFIEG
ncbi:cubilin [Orussus abietinus]|uniref:cubilin n=1 Tax=Orussus abietinus TaxID=222816 RepID=UPI000626CC53|nr:cubilin [Orussus abietinus]XP_012276353.1 cubilin [Orussus abietinus]XP_012276354.1 cubilin [Orussus abietinus]